MERKLQKSKVSFRVECTCYHYVEQGQVVKDRVAEKMVKKLRGVSACAEEVNGSSGFQAMLVINEARRVRK